MNKLYRLPPISALRAFDVAARELSFTKAAEELHVSQSAVSHQIRHIESLWGFPLFVRHNRQVSLTRQAHALVPVIREFFKGLDRTLNEISAEGSKGPLRVSLLQSFAFKWLVPRLGRFNQAHAGIDVWISSTDDIVDFDAAEVDVAIRLGPGGWPGLHETLLLREYVFPVCSPELYESMGRPQAPAALLQQPLLYRYADDICAKWRDWFADAGVEVGSLPPGTRFPSTSMAVQAAIDGQGVALARSAHVEDDLEAGRLIKLFDVHSPSHVKYFLVCPLGNEQHVRIAAFREWLLREAVISQAAFDRVGIPRGQPRRAAGGGGP